MPDLLKYVYANYLIDRRTTTIAYANFILMNFNNDVYFYDTAESFWEEYRTSVDKPKYINRKQ
jgi:hypothetical protein